MEAGATFDRMVSIDMRGKTALVMGVANARSLGWAIAEPLLRAGCRVGFSYQGERLQRELEKLTAPYPDQTWIQQADVSDAGDMAALFDRVGAEGGLDYLVHAIAYAPKSAMEGRFIETTPDDWNTALSVSAYSLVSAAQHAEKHLRDGGSIVSLTFQASQRVVPKYNVMGVAKAALEAATRYLAVDLGERGIRVNTVSAGPARTVAARSIPGFGMLLDRARELSAMDRNITPEEVGGLGLFLLSDLSTGITGQTVYVDAGSSVVAITERMAQRSSP